MILFPSIVCYLLEKKNFFINLLVCNLFVYLHSENKPKDSYKLSSFLTYQITNEAMGIYIV